MRLSMFLQPSRLSLDLREAPFTLFLCLFSNKNYSTQINTLPFTASNSFDRSTLGPDENSIRHLWPVAGTFDYFSALMVKKSQHAFVNF